MITGAIEASGFIATYKQLMLEHGYSQVSSQPYMRLSSERCPVSLNHCIRLFNAGYEFTRGAVKDSINVLVRTEDAIGFVSIIDGFDVHNSDFAKKITLVTGQWGSPINEAIISAGVPISDAGYATYWTALRGVCSSESVDGVQAVCEFHTLQGLFSTAAPVATEMFKALSKSGVPVTRQENGKFAVSIAMPMHSVSGSSNSQSGNTSFLIETIAP
jgi:hypothetical protein